MSRQRFENLSYTLEPVGQRITSTRSEDRIGFRLRIVPANEILPKSARMITPHIGNGILSDDNVCAWCVGGLFRKDHGGKFLGRFNRRYGPSWGIRKRC